MTALLGTFVNVKTMADGTPRLVLDLQCTLAEIAALGLIPGTPFGIARITGESSLPRENNTDIIEVDSPHTKPGPLHILACRWCKDPEFWEFLRAGDATCTNEDDARLLVLRVCGITSRRELDTLPYAAEHFHEFIREPFMCWKAAQ